jgi:hypothetical protein
MVFPTNNLPTSSKFWAREVEKKVTNLESTLRSSDINNTTRDSQLSVTAGQALIAAQQAIAASTASGIAAGLANDAISSIADLGSPGGPTINAANITAGSISGNRISGGEIIGTTLKTAASGRRVEMLATNTSYFDENGNFTGRIIGSGTDRGATIEIYGPGSGLVQVWSGGVLMYSAGGNFAGLSENGLAVGGRLYTLLGGSIDSDSTLSAVGSMTSGSVSTGSITSSSLGTGSITSSSLGTGSINNSGGYSGNGFPTVAANTVSGTTTFAPNVFINTSGNMARNTTASERRAKESIEDLNFDTDAFIGVNPVRFNYKREAVSDDAQAEAVNLGFILDDFEDIGMEEFLVATPQEGDEYKQLRYQLLYMYLHKVVQSQNTTIKSLEQRLAALEAK